MLSTVSRQYCEVLISTCLWQANLTCGDKIRFIVLHFYDCKINQESRQCTKTVQLQDLHVKFTLHQYMAEILPIWHKTPNNALLRYTKQCFTTSRFTCKVYSFVIYHFFYSINVYSTVKIKSILVFRATRFSCTVYSVLFYQYLFYRRCIRKVYSM